MACARGYSGLVPEPLPHSPQTLLPQPAREYVEHRFKAEIEEDYSGLVTDQPFPQPSVPAVVIQEPPPVTTRRKTGDLANSYDWDPHLTEPGFVAAPVNCFRHAPMADVWGNILVGMKVEVGNTDCEDASEAFPDSFWVATVLRIVGYVFKILDL